MLLNKVLSSSLCVLIRQDRVAWKWREVTLHHASIRVLGGFPMAPTPTNLSMVLRRDIRTRNGMLQGTKLAGSNVLRREWRELIWFDLDLMMPKTRCSFGQLASFYGCIPRVQKPYLDKLHHDPLKSRHCGSVGGLYCIRVVLKLQGY